MIDDIKVKFIPATHWWKRAQWELLKDYTSNNEHVTVPVGFVTDGATIPMPLRWLLSPTGRYFGAAIIHDYVIVEEKNWDKANDEFECEMRALDIDSLHRRLIMGTVKLYSNVKRLF